MITEGATRHSLTVPTVYPQRVGVMLCRTISRARLLTHHPSTLWYTGHIYLSLDPRTFLRVYASKLCQGAANPRKISTCNNLLGGARKSRPTDSDSHGLEAGMGLPLSHEKSTLRFVQCCINVLPLQYATLRKLLASKEGR